MDQKVAILKRIFINKSYFSQKIGRSAQKTARICGKSPSCQRGKILLYFLTEHPDNGVGGLCSGQRREGVGERKQHVYKFLGPAASAAGRADQIRTDGGRLPHPPRRRGAVPFDLIAGKRVQGGGSDGVPLLPRAGL